MASGGIVALITAALSAFVLLFKALKKSEQEKEQAGRSAVDEEHDKNASEGRPSDDFWKGRGI